MSSQICLKWNSFLNNIATSFESLWEEEGLVDVTLASDGQCLTAHKVILSASSPFFKKVFQANPCQHPVIILQDVHFTELEALLIFIYKGEVNIEQKNLPALLKAAETLQIRGLTGGDVLPVESYANLNDTASGEETSSQASDEAPKKKHKLNHDSNVNSLCHSIIDKALMPKKTRQSSECSSEKNHKDANFGLDSQANSTHKSLQMKVEPFDVITGELQGHVENNVNPLSQPNAALSNEVQGPRESPNEDLAGFAGMPGYRHPKPAHAYQQLPYADLLPSPDVISTWASSRPLDHLACDIMKILFSHEERIVCNVNGKMGKQQFDSNKIHLIREVLLHYSGLTHNSVEWEEVWKNCVTKIDTSNRGLKRYLFQRRSVYTQ